MVSQHIEPEAREVYERMIEVFFYAKPLDDLKETVHQEFFGYGTAAHEFFESRRELQKMAKLQAEQLRQQKFEISRKKVMEKLLTDGTSCLIVEEFDLYLSESDHQMHMRLSTILELMNEKWLVTHFHGSTPDSNIDDTEALPLEGLRKKNAELEARIKERTRDLEIEAALERVRSRSMAMHKSEELADLSLELVKQVQALGVATWFCAFNIYDDDPEGSLEWGSNGQGTFPKYRTPREGIFLRYYEAGQRGETLLINEIGEDECPAHYEYLCSLPGVGEQLLKMKDEGIPFPASQIDHVAFFKYGYVLFITYEPTPESHEIFIRFAKVFEQTYTRFLDLQKAEAQAREAQIEAALERVRAAFLAMHQSEEIAQVAATLFQQFADLGVQDLRRCVIWTLKAKKNGFQCWYTTEEGDSYANSFSLPLKGNATVEKLYKTWKSRRPVSFELWGKSYNDWGKFIRKHGWKYPKGEKSASLMILNEYPFEYGLVEVATYSELSEADHNLAARFTKAFELTYTRFLDLQKAESQAREAQIEAALERVRSKAMAMHSSDDLADTVEILYKELDTLQVHALRFGHAKVNSDTKIVELHTATDLGKVAGQLKLEGHPLLEKIYEHYLAKEDLYYALQGEEMKSYYSIVGRAIDVPIPPMDTVQHGYFFFLGDTANYAWSDKALDEEELKVYRRLITVLNLTYKRYEELKNAETQAREAQIEGALERVRSKTMAMHNSEELEDIGVSLFDEVLKLGIDKSIRCGIGILEGHEGMETRSVNKSSDGTLKLRTGMLNMTIHPMLVGLKKAWKSGRKSYSYEYSSKDVRKYYTALNNEPEYPFNADLTSLPNQEYHRSFFFSSGIIFAFSENPISEESSKILARFAAVFGQTYQRFLDLQKAEDRAKDAVKQASLDRVRGQIASMRSTQDLERITPLVWNELTTLGIPFIRCGVFIIDESDKTVQAFLSAPDGHSLGAMKIPFDADKDTAASVAHWKKKEVYKTHWDKSQFLEFMQLMMDLGQVSNKKEYQGAEQPPESLYLHFVPFTQGMLYVGNAEPLDEDQIESVQSLADAFAIAYARYEDFIRLEKAKKQVENTLEELKSAQNQLIQSEKMASLGELTAGIAHEIQNPLNFVNNFSEVSVELLEELQEEMKKGDLKEVNTLIEDIQQNLDKINHHGQRADGIVKGMLQHSRAGSGEKELTDLNVLADEYLRLAYHGLRAKDKTFNANMETHFDEGLGKVNVVPQDIGRVILNLITNAFYVVKEKGEQQPEGYQPTVTVTTKKKKDKVLLSVKDNGNGIPKKIQDKIFQPFFTTKPTGQGTGLGLSMSYDIVTKGHGGDLKVESVEGIGTTMTISLPIQKIRGS